MLRQTQIALKLYFKDLRYRDAFLIIIIIIIGPPAMAERVLWIRVCLFVLPSFRLSVQKFSWDWLIWFFQKLSMVLGVHVLLRMAESDFLEKVFLPKKWVFKNLLENLVIIFFWIWSTIKVCTIFCILAQIPYLGKI